MIKYWVNLIEQQPIKPEEVCGDTVYGGLFERKILPSILRRRKHGGKFKGGFLRERFSYNKQEDIYICPNGKKLIPKGRSKRWHWRAYKADIEECKKCLYKKDCAKGEGSRTIIRYGQEEALDFALKHLESEWAKDSLRECKIYSETIFAEAKERHGLRRAMYRGLDKVKIQALLTSAVQNIKRLVKKYYEQITELALNLLRKISEIFFRLSYQLKRVKNLR